MTEPDEDDDQGVVDATPERCLRVITQMPALPWPTGEEWVEWELDGLEGQTSWLMHVLPLASSSDGASVAALLDPLRELGDRRWGRRHPFDATRFTDDRDTDPAAYDRRSAVASLVRSLDATVAQWWRFGADAVVLVDGSVITSGAARPRIVKACVLVLPVPWLLGDDDGPTGAAGTGDHDRTGRRERSTTLLDDLCSGDRDRVLPAVWAVIRTRDPETLVPLVDALPEIEAATGGIELGGMLIANRTHLEHALDRVRLAAAPGCLCAAYPGHLLYDPTKEESARHVRVLSTIAPEPRARPVLLCACTDCGRRFEVEEGDYHYTCWTWTPVAATVRSDEPPRPG